MKLRWLSLLLLSLALSRGAVAAPTTPRVSDYPAVLLVGDGYARHHHLEDELVSRIRRDWARQGYPQDALLILVYHFNKPQERAYCEKKLHIFAKDLFFVGLADHAGLVVRDVLLRQNNVREVEDAAQGLLRQEIARISGGTLPLGQSPGPAPLPSAAPPRDERVEVDRMQMCHAVDAAGLPRDSTSRFLPDDTFVLSAVAHHVHPGTTLQVKWYHNGRLLREPKPLYCDKTGSFYVWFRLRPDPVPHWAPGSYYVEIYADDQYKTRVDFTVSRDD